MWTARTKNDQDNLFFYKTNKTRKYSKSAIFVWYENFRRWFLGAQSINTESFFKYIVHVSVKNINKDCSPRLHTEDVKTTC